MVRALPNCGYLAYLGALHRRRLLDITHLGHINVEHQISGCCGYSSYPLANVYLTNLLLNVCQLSDVQC